MHENLPSIIFCVVFLSNFLRHLGNILSLLVNINLFVALDLIVIIEEAFLHIIIFIKSKVPFFMRFLLLAEDQGNRFWDKHNWYTNQSDNEESELQRFLSFLITPKRAFFPDAPCLKEHINHISNNRRRRRPMLPIH